MGIYIKGMEMPTKENETIIRIQPDGTVLDQYGHYLAITAIPVPPHGDLVDVARILSACKDETGRYISYEAANIGGFLKLFPVTISGDTKEEEETE